jgi:vitamin-K-epoxide reductase (warfarin-sensitive)
MITLIRIIIVIGFLLSVYAYSVECKKNKNNKYKAICDINDRMSCSKAFLSPYGKIFGVKNSLFGIVFYVILFGLSFYSLTYVFYLSVLAVLGSIYLAYLLYFKIKSVCLVCTSIYLVNILLLIFSYLITL